MREVRKVFQPSLWQTWLNLKRSEELKRISKLLDEHPELSDLVFQDLNPKRDTEELGEKGVLEGSNRGRKGLTADQVLRALIVRQMNGFSYRELEFHLADSASYRNFCGIGLDEEGPKRSALASAIKALRAETLEQINRVLVAAAQAQGIEDGQTVRVDCTVVETTIGRPTDSELLWDSVRVLANQLRQARKIVGQEVVFEDSTKAANRCRIAIAYATRKKARKPDYQELIRLTEQIHHTASSLLPKLSGRTDLRPQQLRKLRRIVREIERVLPLTQKVIGQTRRRVVEDESVPSREKVASIFEDHTDIINKGGRDTEFGHKVCLTVGTTSLVLDCEVLRGNPNDSTLTEGMIDRQVKIYGRAPEQASFDGCFASKDNLKAVKGKGVLDVVFAKKRGLKVEEMARTSEIYRKLRNFRAGIEGVISFLKRVFGLDRCPWKSWESFKSYVWSAIVASNLRVLARQRV